MQPTVQPTVQTRVQARIFQKHPVPFCDPQSYSTSKVSGRILARVSVVPAAFSGFRRRICLDPLAAVCRFGLRAKIIWKWLSSCDDDDKYEGSSTTTTTTTTTATTAQQHHHHNNKEQWRRSRRVNKDDSWQVEKHHGSFRFKETVLREIDWELLQTRLPLPFTFSTLNRIWGQFGVKNKLKQITAWSNELAYSCQGWSIL